MYGLIGKMLCAPDDREELISILLAGTAAMPGCLSYVIAQAIARGKPLITGFGERFETGPVGGQGI